MGNLFADAYHGKRGPDQQRIAREVVEVGEKLLRKNNDYGSSAWKEPILARDLSAGKSILVRMSDKLERILELSRHDSGLESLGEAGEVGETIADTLDDLVGYWVLYQARPGRAPGEGRPQKDGRRFGMIQTEEPAQDYDSREDCKESPKGLEDAGGDPRELIGSGSQDRKTHRPTRPPEFGAIPGETGAIRPSELGPTPGEGVES